MKNVFTFLFFTLMCITTNAQSTEPKTERLESVHEINSPGRPRTPMPSYLECCYAPGYFCIDLPDEIEYVYVTIVNADNIIVWEGYITHEVPTATLPTLLGEYAIICISKLT